MSVLSLYFFQWVKIGTATLTAIEHAVAYMPEFFGSAGLVIPGGITIRILFPLDILSSPFPMLIPRSTPCLAMMASDGLPTKIVAIQELLFNILDFILEMDSVELEHAISVTCYLPGLQTMDQKPIPHFGHLAPRLGNLAPPLGMVAA